MSRPFARIVSLGAYCPRVKLSDEKTLALEKQRAKRRTRPLIGRGNYGANLMAHFAAKRHEAKKAKAALQFELRRAA